MIKKYDYIMVNGVELMVLKVSHPYALTVSPKGQKIVFNINGVEASNESII